MVAKIVFVGRRWLPYENRAHPEATGHYLNHSLIGQPSVENAFQHHTVNLFLFLRFWLRPMSAQPICSADHWHVVEQAGGRLSSHQAPNLIRKFRLTIRKAEVIYAIDKHRRLRNKARLEQLLK